MIDEGLENLQRLCVRHGDQAQREQKRVFNLNKSHTHACMHAHSVLWQALDLQRIFFL